MFRAGLDGVDPAPFALVEVGGRQQIADGENAGQRRADLVGERRQRGLDHAGAGGGRFAARRASLPAALADALFRRPLLRLSAWCAVSAASPP